MRAGRIQDVDVPLRRVLVRPPSGAFAVSSPGDWGYQRVPELSRACEEHAGFRALLADEGVEVVRYEKELPGLADALFVYDPVLVTGEGVVVLRMGKPGRQREGAQLAGFLASMEWPLLGRIEAPGTLEGGDLLWLDDTTLAVGPGFRTNREGARQLAKGDVSLYT